MSRPLRIEFPGAYYYVVQKANGHEKIFKKEADAEVFFEYLRNTIIRYDIRLHGFALLPDSCELLLETIDANLSKAMHYLSTGFSMRYNAGHRREGHLFRGRYKAIIVQPGEYLCYMSRRCHLSSVDRGLAQKPEEYAFSSYKYFIDPSQKFQGLTVDAILDTFDRDRATSAVLYKRFVESAVGKKDAFYETNLRGGFILGSQEFVDWMRKSFMEGKDASEMPVIKKFMPPGPDPARIKEVIDREFAVRRLQRRIGIYLARKYTQHKLRDIAKVYGRISDAGISQCYYRTETERKDNPALEENIQQAERLLKTLHIVE
jgi:putative transposase